MDFLKEFGKNVAKYRRIRGLTQEKLAEKLDLSLTVIGELETGKSFIKSTNLTKLVEVLDVTYRDLFDFGETPDGRYLNMIVAQAKKLSVEQQKQVIEILKTFN